MTRAEKIHMLVSVGINPNNSDIEFEFDDEKCYQKQAKKRTKAKKKGGRR